MNYNQFKENIVMHLKQQYPEEQYDVNLRQITKNNGINLDGLCIFKKGEHISPTIYLNAYYEKYVTGMILADVICAIITEYQQGMKLKPLFPKVEAYYEAIKDQIIMRLVNYEKNKEILEDCPYIRYYDLAISFRWLAHWDEIGISTALITNSELKQWGIDVWQLYEDAMENTQRIFPLKIQRLRDMICAEDLPEDYDLDLYVLSNEQGINGATSILYNHVLKELFGMKNCNYYVLPSSIHEMMICPDSPNVSKQMLLSLVKEANHMVVTMGEVLSDNIYYYDSKKERLSIIQNKI